MSQNRPQLQTQPHIIQPNDNMITTQQQIPSSQTTSSRTERPWRGIFFRGPNKARANDKKEATNWSVFKGDDQGQPTGKTYYVTNFDRAARLAEIMSRDRGIDIIDEASEIGA